MEPLERTRLRDAIYEAGRVTE